MPITSRARLVLILLFLWMPLLPRPAAALPVERLDIGAAAVLDAAKVLAPEEREALEQRLRELRERGLMQAAVVIVDSTDGVPIFTYGMEIAEKWRLGEAGKDNGLLMLIAVRDRTFHTFTGDGLEGVLTDVSLARIQRDAFPPNFRENRYARGIEQAIDEMEKRLAADKDTLRTLLAEDERASRVRLFDSFQGRLLILMGLALCAGLYFFIILAVECRYSLRRIITVPAAGALPALIARYVAGQEWPVGVATGAAAAFLYLSFAPRQSPRPSDSGGGGGSSSRSPSGGGASRSYGGRPSSGFGVQSPRPPSSFRSPSGGGSSRSDGGLPFSGSGVQSPGPSSSSGSGGSSSLSPSGGSSSRSGGGRSSSGSKGRKPGSSSSSGGSSGSSSPSRSGGGRSSSGFGGFRGGGGRFSGGGSGGGW